MKGKVPLLTNALIVAMVIAWFVDVLGFSNLYVSDIRIGLHYLFEFPLIVLCVYQISKYPFRYTVYAVMLNALFWVLTAPLQLRIGYNTYWILNSALLFFTFILLGFLIGFVERNSREEGSGKWR